MDELILSHLAQMEADAEEEDEDCTIEAATATLLMYTGAEESRLARARNRLPSRLYLCRPQLCPNPRIDTPWQHLYRTKLTLMGPSCQDNNGRTEGKDCLVIQRQSYTQYWEDGCDAKTMRNAQGTMASTNLNVKCARFGGVQSEFGPKKVYARPEKSRRGGGYPPSRSRFIEGV